jgi:hypothetical protein
LKTTSEVGRIKSAMPAIWNVTSVVWIFIHQLSVSRRVRTVQRLLPSELHATLASRSNKRDVQKKFAAIPTEPAANRFATIYCKRALFTFQWARHDLQRSRHIHVQTSSLLLEARRSDCWHPRLMISQRVLHSPRSRTQRRQGVRLLLHMAVPRRSPALMLCVQ